VQGAPPLLLQDVVAHARSAFAAQDLEKVVDLLATNPMELWYGLSTHELAAMFRTIPTERIRANPAAFLIATMFFGTESAAAPADPALLAAVDANPGLRRWRIFSEAGSARLAGDLGTAYEVMRSGSDATARIPFVVDRTLGVRSFSLCQTALTAIVVGEFRDALGFYDRVLLAEPTPGMEFFAREARVRAAMIHAQFGDPVIARMHLLEAEALPRTQSWVEARLDRDQEVVELLLAPAGDTVEESFERMLALTHTAMGEIWPLYLAALQRIALSAGKGRAAKERFEALRDADLGVPAASGFSGSIIAQGLALEALLSGHARRARKELESAEPRLWGTRFIECLAALSSSANRSAQHIARGMEEQTRGLRQAEARRVLLLAIAFFQDGREDEAVAQLMTVGGDLLDMERAMLSAFSPRLCDLGAERVPGWPEIPTDGAVGLMDRPRLTSSERKVLEALAQGLPRAQIAQKLFISENTVKSHQRALYRKLGVNAARQAVLKATEWGLG